MLECVPLFLAFPFGNHGVRFAGMSHLSVLSWGELSRVWSHCESCTFFLRPHSLFTQVNRLVQSQLNRTWNVLRKTLPPFPCFLVSIFSSCFGRCQWLFSFYIPPSPLPPLPSAVEMFGNSQGLCEQGCERAAHDWSVREACETAAGMMAEDWNALPWLDRAKEWRRRREWGCGWKAMGGSRRKLRDLIGAMDAGKYMACLT